MSNEQSQEALSLENQMEALPQEAKANPVLVSPAQEEGPPAVPLSPPATAGSPDIPATAGAGVEEESCPTCGPAGSNSDESESFIYAMGTIEVRFPSMAVEKEFAQAIQGEKTANLTDTEVVYNILKANHYLAREVCWVLTIEGIETYILIPRDPHSADQLVEAVKPGRTQGTDCDVVIGVKGSIAPAEMCNGLMVPIVLFDQIYSFDVPGLIKAIPKPKGVEEKAFRAAAEEVFYRIQQMADNVGAMDEHRAINYLAVRYPSIYALTADKYAEDCSLTGVEVIHSRLSGVRRLLDVVLSYTNRKTDVLEKYYVRVDLTEKFPFLVNKLAPFYDR